MRIGVLTEKGQALAAYGLFLALLALIIIAGLVGFGMRLAN